MVLRYRQVGPVYDDANAEHRAWLYWEFIRGGVREEIWGKVAKNLDGQAMNALAEILNEIFQNENALAAAKSDHFFDMNRK